MSHPRTPEHFPRMKVRGRRRRFRAGIEQAWRGMRQPVAKLTRAFVRLTVDTSRFTDAMNRFAWQLDSIGWLARRRAHNSWVSSHMLPATPSPWAAPIRTEAL